jgi:aminoacrylate hydrolase
MAAPLTLRVARPDGADLAVHAAGSGPAVMLISGLGGTAGFWRPVTERLSSRFTVVTLDQRGIAASTRGTAAVTIETLAEDCAAVLDALKVKRAVLVGHSTGGCIAMTLAARAPAHVAGAVLSATWLTATAYMKALFAARRATLDADPEAYATLGTMLGYPSEWLEAHWSVLEGAARQAPRGVEARRIVLERIEALLAFDGRGLVGSLAMRCLVFGARDDLIVPLSAQQAVHAALPRAELAVLETGGHFFPVTRTDEVTARLAAFVEACQ